LKTTRRRVRQLTIGVAVLSLALTACGGGGSTPDDDASDETSAGGTDLPDLSGESLEVAAVWTGAEQKTFEKVIAGFEDETGADVSYVSTGDDIATVLGTKVEGGSPPDVAILPQPGLLAQFAESGDIMPVSADIESAVSENYAPIWTDLGSNGGELYGVWVDASNKSTVWYNQPLFDQAGIAPPATWEEFVAASQTLSDSGVQIPVSLGGADGWTLTDWFENVYLRTAGAEMYDKLSTHEIPWTDPTVTVALETLAELWADELLVGDPSAALQTDFTGSVTNVFNESPQSAVVYEGGFVSGVISESSDFTVGEDAKFFPFPSVDDSEPSVVGGGDVAVQFTDSEATQAFLTYLATSDAAAEMVSTGIFTSANTNLDSSAYPDETSKGLGEAIVEAGDNFRFDMSDLAPSAFGGTVGAGEWKILQDFLADPSDIEGTQEELESAAAKAFK
jgi:ABC-type glycerol-3-phosphate transport system substrate-binding protein